MSSLRNYKEIIILSKPECLILENIYFGKITLKKSSILKKRLFDFIRTIIKLIVPESLICNYTIDTSYGSLLTKLVPNHYQYKVGSYRTICRNGINFQVDISDLIGWYIYFGFKEKAKEHLIELAEIADIVLDIGANIGETSLRLGQKIQTDGKVFAFEPAQYNYNQLQKNLSLNSLKNISTYPLGIGAFEGKFKLYTIDQHNKGKNKISENNLPDSKKETIQLTTIDQFVKSNQIPKVDLIKLDIEGFEMKALKGGMKTLKKYSPKLFIEIDNQHLVEQGSSAKELFNYLMAFNYELIEADNKRQLDQTLNYEHAHFDLIAIPLKKK